MSAALAAFGTLLKRGAVTIAEVTKLELPNLKLDTTEVTSHSSTSGWKEFIGLLKDGGEFTIEINYVPITATHRNASGGMPYDLTSGTATSYSIVLPDSPATTFAFTALVTNFKASAPVDGKLMASVTFRTTGVVTFT